MSLTVALPYQPFPRQAAFHSSDADEVLFGGAAGPGKSLALLNEMFMQAVETPGNEVLIFRRTYPQLENSLIKWSREGAPGPGRPGKFPHEFCSYNSQNKTWRMENGSRLRFGHAENPASIYNYQGQEFGGAGVDEITEWEEGMYRFLLRLVRSTLPGVWPRVRCTTNPLGIGFDWVKARWVQPVLDGTVNADQRWRPPATDEDPEPMSRAYIPALLTDNPALLRNDPGYRRRLMSLPRRQRIALLNGLWELPGEEGAPFDPDIVDAARRADLQLEEPRWRCPSCGLEFHGVRGSAFCLLCRRSLRPRSYLTGWDLARKQDWTVGITVDIESMPARIVAFERFKRLPWPEVTRRIEERNEAYPGSVLIDATGVGDVIEQYLTIPVDGVLFSGVSKNRVINDAIVTLENGEIVGPARSPDTARSVGGIQRLWSELLAYQWEDEGLVQDCVVAFALVCKAIQAQAGGVRIWSMN